MKAEELKVKIVSVERILVAGLASAVVGCSQHRVGLRQPNKAYSIIFYDAVVIVWEVPCRPNRKIYALGAC